MNRPQIKTLWLWVTLFGLAACGKPNTAGLLPGYDSNSASPPSGKAATERNETRNLYFGDLHIHTSLSTDAWMMGVRATPDDAYTFAKGGTIRHALGTGVKLQRPLDFAAVTDHAEYMGAVRALAPNVPLQKKSIRDRHFEDSRLSFAIAWLRTVLGFSLKKPPIDKTLAEPHMLAAWQQIIETANRHNQPNVFTALIGYEWSSMPDGQNLHRNVIYKGDKGPRLPFSSVDSDDPRELWKALEHDEAAGLDNLAIPHNGNVSDGRMYDWVAFDGSALNAAYAAKRMKHEPISEIFQVKGSSETNSVLSPNDEFAGFEIYQQRLAATGGVGEDKGSYMRNALRTGLEFGHAENFNPYRFGVIGSSDSHNASASVEENSYHGKLPAMDGSPAIRLYEAYALPKSMMRGLTWSAAGLAAVWAEQNTREGIFNALERKETYATSGPRIALRFFGGWNYFDGLLSNPERLELAYRNGVPMGGDLPAPPTKVAKQSPTFLFWASKDALGANLDRLQVVKGWVDEEGVSHEKIWNVAVSDGRSEEKPEDVGNTVNVAAAKYTNTIGAAELSAFWQDPEFESNQAAFYYARAIEIPTPRWSTFDAKKLGITAPEPASIRERAVSSAIWYKP